MGHPGREYVYELKGQGGETSVARARYVLTSPETTFNMQIVRGKDKPAPSDEDVTSFFESLKLVAVAMSAKPAAPPKLTFKAFAPRRAGFSVLMPGKPDETPKKDNGTFKFEAYECDTAAGSYSVSILEYGPEIGNTAEDKKPEILLRLCDGFVNHDKGKVAQQLATKLQGYPARYVRWSFPAGPNSGYAEARTVMVGAKVFVAMVKLLTLDVDPADPDKFFNSFKLTNVDAPAVAANAAPGAMVKRGRPATAPRLAGRTQRQVTPPTRPGRVAAAPRTPRPERISWKRFDSAVGGFSVDMPGGEPEQTHDEDGLMGAKGVEIITGEHDETRFIVKYQDLTRAAAKKGARSILRTARDSDEKAFDGKIAGEKEATLKGASGGWGYQIESAEPDGIVARCAPTWSARGFTR